MYSTKNYVQLQKLSISIPIPCNDIGAMKEDEEGGEVLKGKYRAKVKCRE